MVLDTDFDVVATNAAVDHLLGALAAPSPSLQTLLAEAENFPHPTFAGVDGGTFALPMQLEIGGTTLRLFSTVATFGTPLDVAASELAIETFVPADAQTRSWLAANEGRNR